MWWDHGRPWSWGIPTVKSRKDSCRGFRRPGCKKFPAVSSTKWGRSNCFKQWAMWEGTLYYVSTTVESYRLVWRAKIMHYDNNEAYRWPLMVHVALPVVWNECTAPILVMRELPAWNFLQLHLLEPLTCILAAIRCEDISKSWSTVIPSHLYPTLKKTLNIMCLTIHAAFNSWICDLRFQMVADNDGHHIEDVL